MVQWHPRLGGIWCAVLLMAVAAWLWVVYRRLEQRLGPPRARWLIAPKAGALLLLSLVLLDPVSAIHKPQPVRGKLLALVDCSSSMDVADDYHRPRKARARAIIEQWQKALPDGVWLDELEFDTSIHKPGASPGAAVRETDLAGCLLGLAERADISSYLETVMLTDGGDEPIESAALPKVPLSFVGIGADPATWNDLALSDVQAPAMAEKDVDFDVTADLQARAGHGQGFAQRAARVRVTLEHATSSNTWERLAERAVDLSNLRARARLPARSSQTGLQRYRVSVESLAGELSLLNNSRTVAVNVQKKALHVLYFASELGQEFKLLRNELGRDPGLSFTALLRTAPNRFTLQGDRWAGDEALGGGFPSNKRALESYDAVIIGSFPAEECAPQQAQALMDFVEGGGTAIFLGGDKSFGRGGYARTSLAALFPWRVSELEPEPEHGAFPVGVPPMGLGHPILASVQEAVAAGGATLESVNLVQELKPGATALLDAQVGARRLAIVALQPFGKGKVLGIASNTLWRWATQPEPLRSAYGLFWRQAIRNLTGRTEGGQNLAVRWDRDFYRPGEQALGEVRVLGAAAAGVPHFTATLTPERPGVAAGAPVAPVSVEPLPGQAQAFQVKLRFRERGQYGFRLVASQAERVLETYEKTFAIAPRAAEGSRLELDETFLRQLAARAGGAYYREADSSQFLERLKGRQSRQLAFQESSLVEAGPWFAGLFLGVLVCEWILRRRLGLF